MKRHLIYILSTIVLLPTILLAQERKEGYMTIAFYNAENFFHPSNNPKTNDDDFTPEGAYRYTNDIFKTKTNNIARVINQLGYGKSENGAAIIGLCEIEDDQVLKALVQHPLIKSKQYSYIRFDGSDKRGINVAMLYQKKNFKLLQSRSIYVDLKPGGGGYTRDILMVEGIILPHDTVCILINHWPSRSGGEYKTAPKRAIAAKTNKMAIDKLLAQKPNLKIILMGDLNDDPHDKSITEHLEATTDPTKAYGAKLYNPWGAIHKSGKGTLTHNDKWNLFDQILFSSNWLQNNKQGSWEFESAHIYDQDFLKTNFGKYKGYPHRSFSGKKWINGFSDHFPTLILLKQIQ